MENNHSTCYDSTVEKSIASKIFNFLDDSEDFEHISKKKFWKKFLVTGKFFLVTEKIRVSVVSANFKIPGNKHPYKKIMDEYGKILTTHNSCRINLFLDNFTK